MPGEGYALADLELLGDDETLRAQADAALDAAGGEPSDTYEAGEATGSIRVTVDRDGLLVDVWLAEWWSGKLEPERFAATLFGIYTAAVNKALVVELSTRDDERRADVPFSPPEDSFEWINATLAANEEKLLAARRAEPLPADESDLRSEHGYVTLRVRGGIATGLTANAEVIGFASARVLRADVLKVFADAGLAAED